MGNTNSLQNRKFGSSLNSIARARKHIDDLRSEISEYNDSVPYEIVNEVYGNRTNKAYKSRLMKPVPQAAESIATDAIYNLRAALDQLIYSAASIAKESRKYTGIDMTKLHWEFPIKATLEKVETSIEKICEPKGIPSEIGDLIREIRPFRGGDDLLFSLNKAANVNKHRYIIATQARRNDLSIKVEGSGGIGPWPNLQELGIPQSVKTADNSIPHRKNEIVLLSVPVSDRRKHSFEITIDLNFVDMPDLQGKSCVQYLESVADRCDEVVELFVSQYRKMGLVS